MDYIKTDEWNEFKTDLNLDPIKEFININHRCFMKYLNTNKLLTERILKILLISLKEIHSSKEVCGFEDVYDNYLDKFIEIL